MANKKILQKHFEFAYFYFSYWFIHSRSSLENHTPILDQNEQSVYPFSDQNAPPTIPFGVAHTYMAYIREYLAPPPPTPNGFININHFIDEWLKSNKFLTNVFEEAELTESP